MVSVDGRSELRHPLRVPIRFYSTDGSRLQGETHTEATNISRHGLFMNSPRRLPVGTVLMLVLRVPTEISGSVFNELRCMGRVVHEREMGDGQVGYGIKLEATAPRQLLGVWPGERKEAPG